MFRSTFTLPRLAAVLGAAILIAACGSSSHHPRAPGSSRTVSVNGVRMSIAQANAALLRFAGCMHTHGVNGLPSPVSSPGAFKHSFTTTTPVYVSALGKCQRLIPGQQSETQGGGDHSRKQIDAMLSFARCIRGHGFTRFPDPTSTGELSHQMLAAAGIDLHQPALVGAADDCASVTHGVITKALVARFIAGQ